MAIEDAVTLAQCLRDHPHIPSAFDTYESLRRERVERIVQSGPSAAETMDTHGHLFPDAEDLGRGAIDAIFAMAPTEQERNQETW